MNKALMIALLFCVSSFTGGIGGDDTTQIEEAIEEEKIERDKRTKKKRE